MPRLLLPKLKGLIRGVAVPHPWKGLIRSVAVPQPLLAFGASNQVFLNVIDNVADAIDQIASVVAYLSAARSVCVGKGEADTLLALGQPFSRDRGVRSPVTFSRDRVFDFTEHPAGAWRQSNVT